MHSFLSFCMQRQKSVVPAFCFDSGTGVVVPVVVLKTTSTGVEEGKKLEDKNAVKSFQIAAYIKIPEEPFRGKTRV